MLFIYNKKDGLDGNTDDPEKVKKMDRCIGIML